MSTTETKAAGSSGSTGLSWARVCKECGQQHECQDSHLYEYQDDVDDELVCHICLQPLLRPMDTPCGHTYCFHCLSNFLKEQDFCPVDRQRLQLQQCRPSSLLVRNLLDKLSVACPHSTECQAQMQRCELQPHLHNRCPVFRRLREEAEKRKRPSWNELKGRRGDGDISGDAKQTALPRTSSRDQPDPGLINPAYEECEEDNTPLRSSLVAEANVVDLLREEPEEELGLRIVGGKDTPLGNIVIQEIIRDSIAARDGRLAPGDHILEASEVRVNFVVMRAAENPDEVQSARAARRAPDPQYFRRRSTFMKDPPGGFSSQEKMVSMKKEPRLSLGITIAGGRDCRSRLPVYITSVQPVGCLHREGTIKRGDVLLSINGADLTQLTYNEAVSVLKAQTAQSQVALRVLQTLSEDSEEEVDTSKDELDLSDDPREDALNWTPLWTRWLGLPSHMHWCRDIVLHKTNNESWGFSIVGGYEESHGQQPFYIKTIVPGTPAHFDGRLKCGDEIVAVNGATTVGMNNSSLIPMLKLQKNKVTLTVVSWPGSLV